MSFDPKDTIAINYEYFQSFAINAAAFGGLSVWALNIAYLSFKLYRSRKKRLVYTLNLYQSIFYLAKILAATSYHLFVGLDCRFRAYSINVPMLFCWVTIYLILMLKLLVFTRYRWLVIIVYLLALIADLVVVFLGIMKGSYSMSPAGICSNVYSIEFKQQYPIEVTLLWLIGIDFFRSVYIRLVYSGVI
jgi:hypothetical protein